MPAMQDAAARLVGEHNFRNFCKMNVANTVQHVRRVDAVALEAAPLAYRGRQDLLAFRIRGSSFLWHQVRRAALGRMDGLCRPLLCSGVGAAAQQASRCAAPRRLLHRRACNRRLWNASWMKKVSG
jgi:tRNA pseudouridine synthase